MPKIDVNNNSIIYSSTQTRPENSTVIPAQVRVMTVPYGGKIRVHVREFFRRDPDGEYQIGRGIAFPPEALEEVIQGLILAQEALENGGQEAEV